MRIMPESDQPPSNHNSPDISKIVKLAIDQVAVERAYRLIDKYIAEKWQAPSNKPDAA
jgi:hypothetical protein